MKKKYYYLLIALLWQYILMGQIVVTMAGSGSDSTTDGAGSAASFQTPHGVALDKNGNVYVTDVNGNRIRKITPNGVVSTLAGTGVYGSADGNGTSATFTFPYGLAVDNSGNVYVADFGNNKIRKITPDGTVSTLAGSGTQGSTDGTGTAATFNYPNSVAVDNSGNVYVADSGSHRIRKITPSGVVTTFAGSGSAASIDGVGTSASFNYPSGITIDKNGNFYVSEIRIHKIRKITPSGVVSTFAGSGSEGSTDGIGTVASFKNPSGIAVDKEGNVYVADSNNNKIRKITPNRMVSTVAGANTIGNIDGKIADARFSLPYSVTVDDAGNIYIADRGNKKIRKIFPNISFPDGNFTYDGTPKSISVSGTLPAGTTITYTGNQRSNVGTYTVAANISGGIFNNFILNSQIIISKGNISGITFPDGNFTYDGTPKSISVSGTLPLGTTVNYTGNGKTDAGNYPVSATISGGNNYNNLTLNANLVIGKGNISGITFPDGNFTYDGTPKSISVSGTLPLGTTVNYTGNEKTDAGNYPVSAIVSGGNNYNNLTLNANLVIGKGNISGITFPDGNFTYDGTPKSISVSGTLPLGTTVNYTGNEKTDAGNYPVSATVSGGNNFNDLILNAHFFIEKAVQNIVWNQELINGCNGENTIQLSASASSGLELSYSSSDNSIASVNGNILQIKKGGTADITVSQAGNNNYFPAISMTKKLNSKLSGKITKKWNDVLVFDNSSNTYVTWQWYKDGTVISGAVSQYYNSPQPLNGTYHAKVEDQQGNVMETCSVTIASGTTADRGIKIAPNPVKQGQNFVLISDYTSSELTGAKIVIADATGKIIRQITSVQPELNIQAPLVQGIYVIRLIMQNGKSIGINLLVN